MKKPVYVTQPFLPSLEEFNVYLEKIWDSKILTNGGQFHQQLEKELCEYLGVKHISLFTNATIALIAALKALDITSGEVITTPYSFVATAHSILWNNLSPVFIDVEPNYFNLSADKIEAAITPNTKAIMPVHVYGNPCETEKIEAIAKKHGLKVIYDAAHAFAVKHNGESLLNAGDLSVISFHATKVFNTFEGGAIVCHDLETKKHIDFLKNFGFANEVTVLEAGINGKMNEIQSAFGLLQLKYIDQIIARRKAITLNYREKLKDVKGITCMMDPPNTEHSYTYFPLLVDENYPLTRDGLYDRFKVDNVFARRYFYPLISEFPMYEGLASSKPSNLPVATKVSQQILCLPLFPDLDEATIELICNIIKHPI